MAAGNLELALRLKAAVEGIEQVAKLATEVEGLGNEAVQLKTDAAALAGQLSTLANQAATIEAFKQVSSGADRTAAALAVVQVKVAAAKSEEEQHAGTLKKLSAELARAETAHREQTVQVERVGNAMRAAGLDARNLSTEEQRLAKETKDAQRDVALLTQKLHGQRDDLRGTATDTRRAADETRRLGDESEKTKAKGDGFVGFLKNAASRVTGLIAAYLGFDAARRAVVDLLETGDQFERFEKQLSSTFGSAAKGQAAFMWVRDFAKRTPLELDQVLDATIKLKNFGLDPLDGTLQALVDQNAKLGGSQEKLERIITATGQAFAKGRLQGEELLQFAEAGVPIFDLLSKVTGKTSDEVLKLAEQGRLGRDVIRDLIKAIGDNAAGDAAEQMELLSGRVSNAKDNYQQFLNIVANNGPLQLAKDEVSAFGKSFEGANNAARAIGQSIVALFNLLASGGNVVKAVGQSFKLTFNAVGAAVSDVLAVIALGLSKITFGGVSAQFAEVASVLQQRSRELSDASVRDAEEIRQSYSDAYVRLGNAVGAGVEAVKAANGEITEAAKGAAAEQNKVADAAAEAAAAQEKAAQLQAEALQKVRADAKALGLDYAQVTTQIDEETTKQIAALRSLAENAQTSGGVIKASFVKVLDGAQTQEEARAIAEAIKGIEKPGFDAAAAIAQIEERIKVLPTEAERANTALTAAFEGLGVTSVAELQRVAEAAEQNFARVRASGEAGVAGLTEAFGAYAQAQLAAAAAQGDAALQARATALEAEAVTRQQKAALDEVFNGYTRLEGRVNSTEDAYRELGITSQAALNKARDAAAAALDELRKSGAPVADQNEAFRVLAERTLAAAAASGKYGLETARANLLAKATTLEQVEIVNQLIQKNLELQSVVKDTGTEVQTVQQQVEKGSQGVGFALVGLVGGLRAELQGYSEAAAQALDKIVERTAFAGRTVQRFLKEYSQLSAALRADTIRQDQAAEQLLETLQDTDNVTVGLIQSARQVAQTFNLVGNEKLEALNDALAQAEERLRAVEDAARSTLDALRDEFDQLTDNEDAIEQRRLLRRREELQLQLQQARATGDQKAIRDLLEAQAILESIARLREEERRKEAADRENRVPSAEEAFRVERRRRKGGGFSGGGNDFIVTNPQRPRLPEREQLDDDDRFDIPADRIGPLPPAPPPPPPARDPRPARTVRVEFVIAGTVVAGNFDDDDAQALLDALERAKRVSVN